MAHLSAIQAFVLGFCTSGYDFAIASSRPHLTMRTLQVAIGFAGNCAPCGLSPQTNGMPVIPQNPLGYNNREGFVSYLCHFLYPVHIISSPVISHPTSSTNWSNALLMNSCNSQFCFDFMYLLNNFGLYLTNSLIQ